MKILLLLCVVFLSTSCSTTKYKVIHKALKIPTQCNFDKFTDEEKESMAENVGVKIYTNQQLCKIRQIRILEIIKAHNKAHTNES